MKMLARSNRVLVALLTLAVLISFSPASAGELPAQSGAALASTWDINVVDSRGGTSASMDLDENGRPHAVYVVFIDEAKIDRALIYARYDGKKWIKETVDSESQPDTTSIAVEDQYEVHASFYDTQDRNLKYARLFELNWEIETVDEDPDSGLASSIVLAEDGSPRIAYWDSTLEDQAVKYASWENGSWEIETVKPLNCPAGTLVTTISLALNSSGRPRILFDDCEANELVYFYHNGTQWKSETVANGRLVGQYNSMQLGSGGEAHISYRSRGVRYGMREGTTWSIEAINDGFDNGYFTSLALDHLDRPQIAYRVVNPDGQGELELAYSDGDKWETEMVDTTGESHVFQYINLELDDADNPHIVYLDTQSGELRYATTDLVIGGGSTYIPVILNTP